MLRRADTSSSAFPYPIRISTPWTFSKDFSTHCEVRSAVRRQWSTKHWKLYVCLFLVLLKVTGVLGMRVKEVTAPQPAITGQNAKLQCLWESKDKQVYTVRWYVNGKQFYSLIRGQKPEKILHKLEGFQDFNVDLAESDDTSVTLKEVNAAYEGEYRCELMSEAPSFVTAFDSTNLTVVNPPNKPVISGFLDTYRLPDTLKVNCTTQNSRPASLIYFFVNGIPIHQDSGRVINLGVFKNNYLDTFTTSSQLILPLSEKYAPKLTLTCRAKVKGFDFVTESSEEAKVYRSSFFYFFSKGVSNFNCASQALLAASSVMILFLQAPW